MNNASYPLEEDLINVSDEGARLIGGHCIDCGNHFFPKFAEYHRPNCTGGPVESVFLSNEGTLVSWTIQHYSPPPPYPQEAEYEATAIGTIELPEGIQIPSQLTGIPFDELRIGLSLRMVAAPLFVDDDGIEALTWKFAPAEGSK